MSSIRTKLNELIDYTNELTHDLQTKRYYTDFTSNFELINATVKALDNSMLLLKAALTEQKIIKLD